MYRCSDSCSVATLQHPYRMKHKAIHIVLERASASVSTALHCTISIDGKYNVHIWKKNAPIKQYDLPLECITMHSAFTLHVSIYTHTHRIGVHVHFINIFLPKWIFIQAFWCTIILFCAYMYVRVVAHISSYVHIIHLHKHT